MYPYISHAAVLLSLACLVVVSARDHYETLGIPRSASLSDIKQAFRKLALRYHPDKNLDDPNAEAKFIEIAQAYEVLSDPVQRRKYDEGGQTNQQKPFGSTFNYGGDEFFKGFNGDHGGSAQDLQERLRRKVAEMHAEALRRAHSFANAAAGGGAQTHQSIHEEAMRRHHETIARMQQQQQHRQQQQQPVHASPVHSQQGRNCRVTKTVVGGTTTTTTVCN